MKKRLISLALTLALCLGLAVPAFAADTSGLDANTRKAYYDVLTAQINKYGIVSVSGGDGLEYATLEDMDANGIPELIMIHIHNQSTADINIWTIRNGKAVQTVNAEVLAGGVYTESNIFFVRQAGRTAVCDSFEWYDRAIGEGEEDIPLDGGALTFTLHYADGTTETISARSASQVDAVQAAFNQTWKADNIKFSGGLGLWLHDDTATATIMQLRSDLAKAPAGGFTDVKAGAYYANAVKWAVDRKITSGTSATTFSPEKTCSVAEILTFLWNANGKPEPTGRNPFSDISTGDYFYKAAVWAAGKGLVSGNKLNPNAPCTRAMVMEYLWKLAGSPNVKSSGYSAQTITGTYNGAPCSIEFSAANMKETKVYLAYLDEDTIDDEIPYIGGDYEVVTLVNIRPESRVAIKGVDSLHIFTFIPTYGEGYDSPQLNDKNSFIWSLGGDDWTYRLESGTYGKNGTYEYLFDLYARDVAILLDSQLKDRNEHRYLLVKGPASMSTDLTNFSDVSSNAAYTSAVTWAVENGITAGTSDTTFSPNNTCTRGEIVTFLYRAMG